MKKSEFLEGLGLWTVLFGALLFCIGMIAVLLGCIRFWGVCTVGACPVMVLSLVFWALSDTAREKERQQAQNARHACK